VAVKEIMLRKPWRGQGIALLIHDELLRDRPEAQVSLLVNALNGDGKVKALYESWGYEPISTQQPSVDGPVLTAMLRRTRLGAGDVA
jgi:GNAT superfamily N-acetyltransferase